MGLYGVSKACRVYRSYTVDGVCRVNRVNRIDRIQGLGPYPRTDWGTCPASPAGSNASRSLLAALGLVQVVNSQGFGFRAFRV